MTTKRKRKYSQDFSGPSLTDQSFAPSCDVNNIVRHYEKTGIDPYIDRKSQARYAEASTLPYEEAMRLSAEIDSAFALLPSQERERYENSSSAWFEDTVTPKPLSEPLREPHSPPADPAPQDSTEGGQGE